MQLGLPQLGLVTIEKRLSPLLEAVCAYVMRRLITACIFFNFVHHNARWQSGGLVAALFFLPCFRLAYALFEFVYLSRERRLTLLRAQCTLLSGRDLPEQLDDFRLCNHGVPNTYQGLDRLIRTLEAAKHAADSRCITHERSLSALRASAKRHSLSV